MMPYQKLNILLLFITLILCKEIPAQQDTSQDSVNSIQIKNKVIQGPPPNHLNCNFLTIKPQNALTTPNSDGNKIQELLRHEKLKEFDVFFNADPDLFMWWVYQGQNFNSLLFGDVDPKANDSLKSKDVNLTITSLALAVHEVTHVFNKQLQRCEDIGLPYFFNQEIYKSELTTFGSENYSIIDRDIPNIWKEHSPRYSHYVLNNKDDVSNNLSVLLDELDAYTASTNVTFALLENPDYQVHLFSNQMVDADIGGMLDFMGYTLYYFRTLRQSYPKSYDAIKTKPNLMKLIQAIWTDAEKNLIRFAKYSSNNGGQFIIDEALIKDIYANKVIDELGALKIHHLDCKKVGAAYSYVTSCCQ